MTGRQAIMLSCFGSKRTPVLDILTGRILDTPRKVAGILEGLTFGAQGCESSPEDLCQRFTSWWPPAL